MKHEKCVGFVSFFDARDNIIEQLKKIIEFEYIYSVEDLVDILKVSREYAQRSVCSKLDNFHLDRFFKVYVRACMGNSDAYIELAEYVDLSYMDQETFIQLNLDTMDLIKKSGLDKYKLSRRVLISKLYLKEFLLDFFVAEVVAPTEETEGVYEDLDEDDVDRILNFKLEDIHHLKEYYDVKTLLQVSRRLEKGDSYVLAKFVKKDTIREYGKKRSLTRYLCDSLSSVAGDYDDLSKVE